MGEVFLAHDTSLDRKDALKFLPDIFAGDPERLARFEREAKLLASLNHPNIAAIYGLEEAQGGGEPIWSRDGRQLFYRQANQVWVADIRTEGGFSASKPRLLFEQEGLSFGNPIRSWDLWPDGQGFLMVKSEETKPQPATEMIFVQNWFEELKRLVPTGK
ncbi:MAG: hypothetical protein LAP85_16760 [Acidobacteriia bacterium]|nr:hypothetical protein [Terriglobia bacterium]